MMWSVFDIEAFLDSIDSFTEGRTTARTTADPSTPPSLRSGFAQDDSAH
jgi:hypothetical protein